MVEVLETKMVNGIRTWIFEGGFKLRELPNLGIFFLTYPKENSDLCEGRHFFTKDEALAFIRQKQVQKAAEQKEFWWNN